MNLKKLFIFGIVFELFVLVALKVAIAQEQKILLPHNPFSPAKTVVTVPTQQPSGEGQTAETSAETPTVKTLERFGYNMFQEPMLSENIGAGGTLPLDYRLGPGDRLGIYLGGKSQEHFEVAVSVDGQIYIPTVGIFSVNDLTIAEFRDLIDQKLQKFYSNYSIEVMLITPKNIGVSIIGEVKAPGTYALSALNSVLDAIVVARGPTEKGSLRDIRLYRNDSLYAYIDLYDFLLRPNSGTNILLRSGDQVYVPVTQSQVEVSGQVRREAIYELDPNEKEKLSDVIALAGGTTDLALLEKVEVSRLKKDGQRRVIYVDYRQVMEDEDSPENIVMQNGDRVHVFSKDDLQPEQIVTIHGEVNNPDEYDYEENMHVSDLILKAGGLTRSAYTLSAEIAKVDPKKPAKLIKINLAKVLDGTAPEQDVLLEPDDHVFIRRIPEWQVGPMVEVTGEVMFPGFYPIIPDSTTLRDVIETAGGVTEYALITEAKLIRHREPVLEDREFERLKKMTREEMSDLEYEYFVMRQNTENVRQVVVDFYKLLVDGDDTENIYLKEGDLIYIPRRPDVVYVSGRVSKPGGVLFQPGANLSYYIGKAGGYSWDADSRKTKVIKVTGEIKDDEDVEQFLPGDRIWVPRKPDRDYWQLIRDTIMVAGQMATIYLVIRNASR